MPKQWLVFTIIIMGGNSSRYGDIFVILDNNYDLKLLRKKKKKSKINVSQTCSAGSTSPYRQVL